MKIIAFSDTHSTHRHFKFDPCDILIFAGDSNSTRQESFVDFIDWFQKQDAKYKVLVNGNHDWYPFDYPEESKKLCKERDIICLDHEAVEIEGIKIFGSPYTPEFCGWAFMKEDEDLAEMWKDIPEDTEILVTHGPVYGILDQCPMSVGSRSLLERVKQLQEKSLRYHVAGHIHTRGCCSLKVDKVQFHNVAVLNDAYKPNGKDIITWEIE